MIITVQFYGVLRRLAGSDQASLALPEPSSVADVLTALEQKFPDLAEMLETTVCAVGDRLLPRQAAIADGDVMALIPPVSGG